MTRRRAASAAVVALLGALAFWCGPVGLDTAQAAGACSGRSGVTVVVDFGALGGGTDVACVADGGGRSASGVTQSSGHPITWVSNQPFACRISGLPGEKDEDCHDTPPNNAYWGLFWSDGTSGWHYSNQGSTTLTVKDGWSVGWRWQDGGAQDQPSAAPHRNATSPRPTPTPKPSPTRTPSPHPSSQPSARASTAPSATAAPSSAAGVPTAAASRRPHASRHPSARVAATPTGSPSGSASVDAAEPTAGPSESADVADGSLGTVTGGPDDGDGPGNDVGVAAVAGLGGLSLLAGSAAVVAYRRRS